MSPIAEFRPMRIEIEIPSTVLLCPHCKEKRHFIDNGKSIFSERRGIWAILRCDRCDEPILAIYKWTRAYAGDTPTLEPTPIKTYPPEGISCTHKSIPQGITEDYKEALTCFNSGAWKATVVLCRRALQSSVVEKGADVKEYLVNQIDDLAHEEIITKDMQGWAHTVRHFGNDGAHPYDRGLLTKVRKEDAEDMLKFMESYLKYVYEMPYEVAEKRKRARV